MNKIVLITGASSGYGKATAKAFKDNGDTVIMTARNLEKLEAARKEVGGDLAFSMDVTKTSDWELAVKTVKEKYGRLDVLVNNAGGGITIKEVSEFTTDEIDATIKLNLNSVIYGCRAFADMMKERVGKDFYLENDANAAAYGEYIAGAGKGTNNFIAITLGTGVGGGIIINGKIYSGSNYAGGELGHTVIEVNGLQCSCGRKGCWEAYSSATGLINMTKKKMAETKDTIMHEMAEEAGKVNGRIAFDAMRKGDKAAKEVVDNYIYYLAMGITNIINISSYIIDKCC